MNLEDKIGNDIKHKEFFEGDYKLKKYFLIDRFNLDNFYTPIKNWMWARDRHQRNAFDVWAMTRNNEVLAVQLPIILV